jgi:hypothetical protein
LKTAWYEARDEVVISNVGFSSDKLTIVGAAPDHASVLEYFNRLANPRVFKRVDILESRVQLIDEASKVSYSFVVKDEVIERGAGQEVTMFLLQALPAVK